MVDLNNMWSKILTKKCTQFPASHEPQRQRSSSWALCHPASKPDRTAASCPNEGGGERRSAAGSPGSGWVKVPPGAERNPQPGRNADTQQNWGLAARGGQWHPRGVGTDDPLVPWTHPLVRFIVHRYLQLQPNPSGLEEIHRWQCRGTQKNLERRCIGASHHHLRHL